MLFKVLWLVPVIPFIGFAILALFGPRLTKRLIAIVGVGSIGVSAIISGLITINFLGWAPANDSYSQTMWRWMTIGSFNPGFSLYLDALSLIMMLVVTFVAFFIHLYSAESMAEGEGYSRFFAYMNLFVGSMLFLVLADNLLLLYLGWEGVGLCSYLLIGFWYRDPANGAAARKAFIVTRIGDAAMIVGLFLIFDKLGTLDIQQLMTRAQAHWASGSGVAVVASALLLGGALGKSAQLPLQTWLPDAMAGPTPVSALIHAATMVTAGVYLIARTHVLFSLAPDVRTAVAIIGVVTLLLAGTSALAQNDIKRVLAYSTISQIGYMFLGLGVGAWSATIFHFMTHAFFKALLFLAAGVVIQALHEEHDMFKMGGLRKQLPVAFWTFLAGSLSLVALPLVTAGFYSKDLILWQSWSSTEGSKWLWAGGMVGVALTSLYTFRMVFLIFFGEAKQQVSQKPGPAMLVPLVVLAVLSIGGGFVEMPKPLGDVSAFTDLLHHTLPVTAINESATTEGILEIVSAAVTIGGIYVAYLLFLQAPQFVGALVRAPIGQRLHSFWFGGWGFDWVYDRLLVWPYIWIARADKSDFIDLPFRGVSWLLAMAYRFVRLTQAGGVRWYAAGIGFGAVVIVAIVAFS